jgi:hypothetical protein
LGVLLYEMVTGRTPFDAETIGDLCDRIDRVEYAPPAQLNPGVPREVAAIISRCLRKNPAERYSSAGELLADARRLARVVSRPGVSPSVSEAAEEYAEAKTPGPSKLPLLIGAAAAAVVLAIVGIVALAFLGSPGGEAADANANANVKTANAALGLKPAPTPAASRDALERVIEITVSDGRADVYRGAEKVGTTPYAVRGRLGERVMLTLRREGYADEPVDFLIGEKKAFMYTLAKR